MCIHRMKIIHRDIKSANCLVNKHWIVKICDYGLSRIMTDDVMKDSSSAGTPEWMAPELIRNEPFNEKCDIFSLGVIMWELCTLNRPWDGVPPERKYGKIDVVVSNAAANPSIDTILETKESVLDKLWEINVKSSILILQEAAPHLQKGSSVILISSVAGYQPVAPMAIYGVTKNALFGLTKALAAEMGPDTRVNCVAPGFVPTNFADFVTRNPDIKKGQEVKMLVKRLGTTGDMAAATAFLASDDASYISGEVLSYD